MYIFLLTFSSSYNIGQRNAQFRRQNHAAHAFAFLVVEYQSGSGMEVNVQTLR